MASWGKGSLALLLHQHKFMYKLRHSSKVITQSSLKEPDNTAN